MHRPLELPKFEKGVNCELKGYRMGGAIEEQLRPPRIVRVAIVQNSIVLPTTDPLREQREAIHKKIIKYVEHAATCGANIVCLQEGWREYLLDLSIPSIYSLSIYSNLSTLTGNLRDTMIIWGGSE
jgi:hypothetical protein